MPGLTGSPRLRVLVIVIVVFGGLGLFLWTRRSHTPPTAPVVIEPSPSPVASPVASETPSVIPEAPSPSPSPSSTPTLQAPQTEPGLSDQPTKPESSSFVGQLPLVIPVAGVRPEQLLDTFTAARSEGRSHDAIDIMAPAGTPVLAAIDGEVAKLFLSDRGGTTIYQYGPDKKLIFYYAHLQRYADGLFVGKPVRQGDVIGYVGDTGNAGAGNYHLHFSIAVLSDPKRYWEGTNINPYPLLKK